MRCFRRELALLIGFAMCGAATEALGQSPGLFSHAQWPGEESYAEWVIRSLGVCGLMTFLVGAVIFVGACVVVFRARRPAVIASYLVFLGLPLLLGILGAVTRPFGGPSAFTDVAQSDTTLPQWQIFDGVSAVLLSLRVAIMVTLPSYFVLAIGLFVRTLRTRDCPGPTTLDKQTDNCQTPNEGDDTESAKEESKRGRS